MSNSNEGVNHYADAFAASPAQNSAAWVRDLRRAGLARFQDLGFPSRRDEGWKYTDVSPIAKRRFEIPAAAADDAHRAEVEAAVFPDLDAHRLVFVNGRFCASLSTAESIPGVRLQNLDRALTQEPDRLQTAITEHVRGQLSGFAALNAAFLHDGAAIEVADDVVVEHPIHLLFLSVPEDRPVAIHPHVLMVAGAASRAVVIEHHLGIDGAENFTNVASLFSLSANAEVEHYKLQQDSAASFHISSTRVEQHSSSRFASHNVDLGGRLVRNDLRIELLEPDAEVLLNGLYLATGRQHVDNHTTVGHRSPRTTSQQCYKGILNGRARAVFNGKVMVHPDAQKTDAQQENHNLLLSVHAEIDTKPELEIYADDVKCSHGTTVGFLDANSLFYLRSRGLAEEVARGLLTFAFAEDVVTRMKLQPLRNRIERAVIELLPQGEMIEEFV
jgi:Fe-S cluster assembly protein SufD